MHHSKIPYIVIPRMYCVFRYLYFYLLEIIKSCASQWREIGRQLGFHEYEIEELEEKPHSDRLMAIIRNWLQWCPGDSRGSKSRARLEDLEAVLSNIGYSEVSEKLKDYGNSK